MSGGFLPPSWRPLSEVRDEIGPEVLGGLLASGDARAFYVDVWGHRHSISAKYWLTAEAREAMERGVAFERRHSTAVGSRGIVETTWPLFVIVSASRMSQRPSAIAQSSGSSAHGAANQNEARSASAPRGRKREAALKAFDEVFRGADPGRELVSDRELHERLTARHKEAGRSNDLLWDLDTTKRVSGRRAG